MTVKTVLRRLVHQNLRFFVVTQLLCHYYETAFSREKNPARDINGYVHFRYSMTSRTKTPGNMWIVNRDCFCRCLSPPLLLAVTLQCIAICFNVIDELIKKIVYQHMKAKLFRVWKKTMLCNHSLTHSRTSQHFMEPGGSLPCMLCNSIIIFQYIARPSSHGLVWVHFWTELVLATLSFLCWRMVGREIALKIKVRLSLGLVN
jgi:hypothetical protein